MTYFRGGMNVATSKTTVQPETLTDDFPFKTIVDGVRGVLNYLGGIQAFRACCNVLATGCTEEHCTNEE